MPKFKVLIADDRFDAYREEKSLLAKVDVEVVVIASNDESELAAAVKDADGLIVNLAPITSKVITAMTQCKCVSRYGVGYDNVDTGALKEKGIFLANVPGYCAEDVSDHALALILDCARKVSLKDRLIRKGGWGPSSLQTIYRTCGKTFGVVGYGAISRCLCRKVKGLNPTEILVYDPFIPDEVIAREGCRKVEFEELLTVSDFISVHAPLVEATQGMFGQKQFEMMKNTAMIVNTSRGPLIQEAALVDALKNSKIACAGLDVFETEPLDPNSELRGLENIIMTDHVGWYSEESLVDLKTQAAQNIVEALVDGEPKNKVAL